MKKQLFILAIAAVTIPTFAVTNDFQKTRGDRDGPEREEKRDTDERGDRKRKERRREISPEEQDKMDERRLQLTEKTLKDIGVTDEQKSQIITLQARLREEMKQKDQRISEARRKLSELQRKDATQEVLFAAIDELSAAQGEKMKALVRDQLAMKRILGEQTYQAFMDSARDKWREHGRRGSGLPSKPELPPIPGQSKTQQGKESPLPPGS